MLTRDAIIRAVKHVLDVDVLCKGCLIYFRECLKARPSGFSPAVLAQTHNSGRACKGQGMSMVANLCPCVRYCEGEHSAGTATGTK